MDWKTVAVLLGVYGFVKEFRPSEPFITPFLTGSDKNFTSEQVNEEIYPVSTYANVAVLIVMFLVTDWLRYKPVLVAQGLTAIAVYAMLIWCQSILMMQIMEVLYGIMWAADISYFTYLFAKAGREHFSDVAAASRAGYLLGRFSSGVFSQVAVSSGLLSLLQLQYVTLGAVAVSAALAAALPGVKTSLYFHKEAVEEAEGASQATRSRRYRDVARLLWLDFREAYSQLYVLKWSLWWIFANGGQMMVLNYIQVLWEKTLEESGQNEDTQWNGLVEAIYTIFGAGAAWLATRGRSYQLWGDAVLAVWSLVAGGLLITAAGATNIVLQYCLYSVFGTIYQGAITVASSEVAQHIRGESQALVYGFNTFVATLLQTLLTVAVAGSGGLELGIRSQFYVYGGYFIVVGAVFVVVVVVAFFTRRRHTE